MAHVTLRQRSSAVKRTIAAPLMTGGNAGEMDTMPHAQPEKIFPHVQPIFSVVGCAGMGNSCKKHLHYFSNCTKLRSHEFLL